MAPLILAECEVLVATQLKPGGAGEVLGGNRR